MPESQPISPERRWSRQVLEEYREHTNPLPTPDIDIVWVVSGWGVYKPSLSPDFVNAYKDTFLENEETEIVNLGIELAYEITAQRLNKQKEKVTKEDVKEYGPVIIYNGNPNQNENLRQASLDNEFPVPQEKLRIEKLADDLDPKNNNTNKQFEKFSQELLYNTNKIAIVSHLWHISRIARNPLAPTLIAQEPHWQNVDFVYFAADKPKEQFPNEEKSATNVMKRALTIRGKIMAEGRKIYTYSQKGDLTEARK